MTAKTLLLTTQLTADEAHLMLTFLTELTDAIWDAYGENIIQLRHRESTAEIKHDNPYHIDDPF